MGDMVNEVSFTQIYCYLKQRRIKFSKIYNTCKSILKLRLILLSIVLDKIVLKLEENSAFLRNNLCRGTFLNHWKFLKTKKVMATALARSLFTDCGQCDRE